MKGYVISFSSQSNSGEISGEDGNRYTFTGEDWGEFNPPNRGMYVDFVADDGQATSIYLAPEVANALDEDDRARLAKSKDKIAAGILAILLGQLGIHKFYLGYTGPGIFMLLATVLTCGVLGIITWIIGVIEGIIYLTKTDAEFQETYVIGRKNFF